MRIGGINGGVEITGKAALAPMAGVADRAFRRICVEYGAAYVVGEMVSSKGLNFGDRKSAELLELGEEERPAAVQLFGDDPEQMARAARLAMAVRPDAIDINMGCPAPKIAGNHCGSALMREPELCRRIVRAVAEAVEVPVTAKIRKGYGRDEVNAVEVAQACAAGGAAAITVHGRTREQMYAPPVDWEIIRRVKEAVDIPVICYNVPPRTGVNIQPATMGRIAEIPNVAGIKEACGNMEQIMHTAREVRGKCELYSGDDHLNLPMLAIGAAGLISVVSNALPRQMKQLYEYMAAGEFEKAYILQDELLPFTDLMFCEVNPIPVKAAADMLGLSGGVPRAPLTELEEAHKAAVRDSLRALGYRVD